jgi:hypothetical protein
MKFLVRLPGSFPNRFSIRRSALSAVLRTALVAVMGMLSLGVSVFAQGQPDNQPPNSQAQTSQAQTQRALRVARISLIEGDVSYQRGGSDGDDKNTDWFDATVNLPLDEKDQVYSGKNGRAEVQFNGKTLARVDRDTNLRIVQFNTSTLQLAQSIGTATFRVDSLDRRQFQVYDVKSGSIDDPLYFEVDTPAVAITFLKEGLYRLNVRDDGTTELIVRKGQAEVYNQELGTIPVKSGRRIIIEGHGAGFYQIAKLEDKDNWDRWNDRRDDDLFARLNNRSSQYVPASVAGAYDLDAYGDWIDTPEYGRVWSPRGVAAGWAPYRSGYWRWYGGWGWTWVSSEPWGWAPYHYGRWTYWRSRWCWTPFINIGVGRVGVGFWDWSPHLVAFVGWGGGGYNRGYRDGYWDGYRDGRGWLGWCPLGVGERWGGGYYGRSRTIINNTIIVNNTNHVRSLDSLRNYHAPNGVHGMEGRRFAQPRVIAENFTAPPRGAARLVAETDSHQTAGPGNGRNVGPAGRGVELAASNGFRPTQRETARTLPVERNSPVARAIEAPVVARRLPAREAGGVPLRNGFDGSASGPARIGREGQAVTLPERGAPAARNGETGIAPNRESNRGPAREAVLEGVTRPERRAPDFRPVERIERPTVTRPPSEDRTPRRTENKSDSAPVFTAPRDRNMPRDDSPRRSEAPTRAPERAAPERNEAPRPIERPQRIERPPVERREMPQRAPERSEAPREQRMPARDSAPPRESAPRNVERPSAPARESAPARAPERSSGSSDRARPSRKNDS